MRLFNRNGFDENDNGAPWSVKHALHHARRGQPRPRTERQPICRSRFLASVDPSEGEGAPRRGTEQVTMLCCMCEPSRIAPNLFAVTRARWFHGQTACGTKDYSEKRFLCVSGLQAKPTDKSSKQRRGHK